MKIIRYMTGPIQVNTYLAYDEESKKGFIVDPGGYCKELTEEVKKLGLEREPLSRFLQKSGSSQAFCPP